MLWVGGTGLNDHGRFKQRLSPKEMDNAMNDFPSQYDWSSLDDEAKKDTYAALLKAHRKNERVIDALCIMAKSYPIHD